MLDINFIREHPDEVKKMLADRQIDEAGQVDRAVELDAQRRALLAEVEQLKGQRNVASKEIGRMRDKAEREARIAEQKGIGEKISALDEKVRQVEGELHSTVSALPNLIDPRTPYGRGDEDDVLLKTAGEPKSFDFEPKPHWELGPALGILDFERGVKITGSRFYVLVGAGARLQRALIAWMLDLHTQRQGYTELYPPFIVNGDTMFGAGQLPKFADNLYKDHEEDLYMVPTAEVPVTAVHRDEILEPEDLPRYYAAYTPCFRREKIAAGRDVRGIKRGHQFDKVEMYMFTRPEESNTALAKMLADAEETCTLLGLTYRVKQLSTAGIGFSARITYDIEVWAPGCGEWLEVSSVSNCYDFQARRSNIKFRPARGAKAEFVHTLNGSGLGLPRTLIGVLENYQQADGSVVVPDVLKLWMGGIERIGPDG